MKKTWIQCVILSFILSIQSLSAKEIHPLNARYLAMTFPKAGTHLLVKLLHIIGNELHHPEANDYIWDHFFSCHKKFWPQGINFLFAKRCVSESPILLIRDLRDVVISCAYWHTKMVTETENRGYLSYIPLQVLRKWNRMSIEEKVTHYIACDFYPEYKTFAAFVDDHIKNMQHLLRFIPDPVIIRYEDLVGPTGGGTLEAQIESIYKIADVIRIHLSTDEVEYICRNLFGKREQDQAQDYMITYRKGGIGHWKTVFTPEQKELFKRRYNWFLVEYGYETDDQW